MGMWKHLKMILNTLFLMKSKSTSKSTLKLKIKIKSNLNPDFEQLLEVKYDESIKNLLTMANISALYNKHGKPFPDHMTVRGDIVVYIDTVSS